MPTITEVLGAAWRVSHDLVGILSAKTFEIVYTKVTASKFWDHVQYRDIGLYSGQANPDLIRIKAEFDGIDADVILGIVDESSREQTDEGVTGRLRGRDKVALVLDRYHPTAYTLQGITVVNNSPIAGLTYRQAVADVATRAGLATVFNVGADDYNLGRTIAVTTDQTYGEIIAQLMEPWRFGERFSHDAFVSDDGLTLTIARRGLIGDRAVNFERLVVDEYRKRILPAVNDVRIEGTTYDTVVSDSVALQGDCDAITTTTKDYDTVSPEQSYIETHKVFRNIACEVFKEETTKAYKDGQRTETDTILHEFWAIGSVPPVTGKLKKTTVEGRDTNLRSETRKVGTPPVDTLFTYNFVNALRSSKTISYEYYTDDASLKRTDEEERIFDKETVIAGNIIIGYAESNRRTVVHRMVRHLSQLARTVITTNYQILESGEPSQQNKQVQTEVSPFTIQTSAGTVVGQGQRTVPIQIAAGPVTAKRREQSDMLGDNVSAELIRQRLIQENAATIVEATVRMTPDHSMRPGKNLVVLGAPAWFDVLSFFVPSTEINADDSGAEQTVNCIAWVDPP